MYKIELAIIRYGLALGLLLSASISVAKAPPIGVVGDILDTEIVIFPELSGAALLRASNTAVTPARITTDSAGHLYIIDNDENDELSPLNAVAIYDKGSKRTKQIWQLNGVNGKLRDVVVAADPNSGSAANAILYLLDNHNKTIEKYNGNGNYIETITLSSAMVNPDTLALDSSGNIYVLDKNIDSENRSKVYKFNQYGDSGFIIYRWAVTDSDDEDNSLTNITDIAIVDIDGSGSEAETLYLLQDRFNYPQTDTYIYQYELNGTQKERFDNTTTTATQAGASRFTTTLDSANNGYFYVAANNSDQLRVRQGNNWSGSWVWGQITSQLQDTEGNRQLDVAAVSFNEIYLVNAYDGKVLMIDGQTTDSATEIRAEDPVGQDEPFDELLRDTLTTVLGDSNNTTGSNINLLAYDDSNDGLTVYKGTHSTQSRLTESLLPSEATLSFPLDLTGAVDQLRDYARELNLAAANNNSCVNIAALYTGPGLWAEPDNARKQIVSLFPNDYSNLNTVAYNIVAKSGGFAPHIEQLTKDAQVRGANAKGAKYPVTKDKLEKDIGKALRDNSSGRIYIPDTYPPLASQVVVHDYADELALLSVGFRYSADSAWRGSIQKYRAATDEDIIRFRNDDYSLRSPEWDAGVKLAERAANDRKLWTVFAGSGTPNTLNNFTVDNVAALNPYFFPDLAGDDLTNAQSRTEDLIAYLRGEDVYNEGAGSIAGDRAWKLGDTYHAKPVIVLPVSDATRVVEENSPEAKFESGYRHINGYEGFKTGDTCSDGISTTCGERKIMVYAPANDGILHAFDWETGEELWGFIPPPLFAELAQIESSEANQSNAIYAIDATPVVKDIHINGSWKTVLMGGLGRGGKGFYALDITDPDKPQHLFSIKNDSARQQILRWDQNGNLTTFDYSSSAIAASGAIAAHSDYSRLAYTWSEPVLVNLRYGTTIKPFAVVGAGYNNNQTDLGDVVYLIDLSQGDIVHQWQLNDAADNDIENSVPASPVAVMIEQALPAVPDPENYYYGAYIYIGDTAGQIWKLNLTSQISDFEGRSQRLFDGQANLANQHHIFHKIVPTINGDRQLSLTFGSSNAANISSVPTEDDHYFAAVIDADFPGFAASSATLSFTDLQQAKNSEIESDTVASCPISEGKQGWMYPFSGGERLSANSTINNKWAVFTTYTPTAAQSCATGGAGKAHFRELGIDCGTEAQNQYLGLGVPGDVNIARGVAYIAVAYPVDVEGEEAEQIFDPDNKSSIRESHQGNTVLDLTYSGDTEVRIELWQEVQQHEDEL